MPKAKKANEHARRKRSTSSRVMIEHKDDWTRLGEVGQPSS